MQPELIAYGLTALLVLCAIILGLAGMLRQRAKPNSGSTGLWFLGGDGFNGGSTGGE